MSRNNVLVNACAGSGKTTTILHLVAARPALDFLILVYNTRLMMETNERIRALGLKNAIVYNYHTLGHRFYSPECDTDQGLKRIIQDKLPVMRGKKLPLCDVLVLDEQQDMTPILKTFIDRVIQDIEDIKNSESPKSNKKGVREQEEETGAINPSGTGKRPSRVRRVLLGDLRQELYGFNDADGRFLTLAPLPELFGNGEEWEPIEQNISYRLTKPNADFINKQMLKPEPGGEIASVKDKASDGSAFPKPRYVFYEPLSEDCIPVDDYEPFREVLRLREKMDYSDILVLAPSLRDRNVIDLANCLALKGHPVQVPDFEDSQGVSLSQSKGKIAVCTYHQSKGIEREAAVVYGFDESYHRYYSGTPEDPRVAGNPQYVAATRAKTDLVILNHCERNHLPFVDLETLRDTCEMVNRKIYSPIEEEAGTSPIMVAVTALTRNIHDQVMSACIQELQLEQISPAYQGSSPPSEIEIDGGLVESVATITGTAVPAMYEYYRRGEYTAYPRLSSFAKLFRYFDEYKEYKGGKLSRESMLFARIQHYRPDIDDHLRTVERKMINSQLDDGDILFLANFSGAIESGLLVKLLSIPLDCYTWFEQNHRQDMIRILSKNILLSVRFEREVRHTFPGFQFIDGTDRILRGRLDISDLKHKRIWEVKYTQRLRAEHILQVALYAGIVEAKHGKGSTCKLINAMSGQVIGISPKTENSYEKIIQQLISSKCTKKPTSTLANLADEGFIKEAGNAFENHICPVVLPSWFNSQKIPRRAKRTVKDEIKPIARGIPKWAARAAKELA